MHDRIGGVIGRHERKVLRRLDGDLGLTLALVLPREFRPHHERARIDHLYRPAITPQVLDGYVLEIASRRVELARLRDRWCPRRDVPQLVEVAGAELQNPRLDPLTVANDPVEPHNMG